MWANLRAAAAVGIGEVLALVPSATARTELQKQVLPYVNSPATVNQVASLLQGPDGKVTYASAFGGGISVALSDGSVRSISQGISASFVQALQLGVYGEKWETLPGIAVANIIPSPAASSLFTFPSLTNLTKHFVPDAQAAATLNTWLSNAETALRNGDKAAAQKAMTAYIEGVENGAYIQTPPRHQAIGAIGCRVCHIPPIITAPPGSLGMSSVGRVLYPY
jgi:hypothetical protein